MPPALPCPAGDAAPPAREGEAVPDLPPPPPPENHNKGGIGNGSAGLEDVILQSTNAGPVAAGIAAVAGIATGAIHIRNKHKAR